MELLADLNASREAVVKACCKSHDHDDIFNYEDILGKYDALQALTDAWLNDKLGTLKMLTDRRIEAEMKLCTRQMEVPEVKTDYQRWNFWKTKLANLELLAGLIRAWHGDSLGLIQFTVRI